MKTTVIFFSDFQWYDLGFFAKILIFLGFLGKINCQDLGEKSEILARNEKNPKSWQEVQDYPRLSKIMTKKTKMPSTGQRNFLSSGEKTFLEKFRKLIVFSGLWAKIFWMVSETCFYHPT